MQYLLVHCISISLIPWCI